MTYDVVVAGVGGQGVISAAALVAEAARREGFDVRQGELHGMSQRGGAVQATVRMSRDGVAGDLIPAGALDLIIGLEPVEALRYVPMLAPEGVVVTSIDPVENIEPYPPIVEVLAALGALPRVVTVEAVKLARAAGSFRAANVVMLGAAAAYLPIPAETLAACIRDLFAPRGDRVVAANEKAFAAGRRAGAPAVA